MQQFSDRDNVHVLQCKSAVCLRCIHSVAVINDKEQCTTMRLCTAQQQQQNTGITGAIYICTYIYTGCGIKNNPLRKLEFLENDHAYFAVFFIS